MLGEVKIVNVNVGAVDNENVPLFRVPADTLGGGITLTRASLVQGGSTNSEVRLVTMGITATPALGGTLTTTAVGGTASPFAANVPQAFTISTAFVDANTWVAVQENNVAACNAQAILELHYVMGR